MKNERRLPPFLAAVVALAAAPGLLAAAPAAAEAPSERVFAVRTARPQVRTIARTLVKTGSLAAPASVSLCAKVPGRLLSTMGADGREIEEGTRVRKGDAVARLDEREYRIALAAAEAAAAAARAEAENAARSFARTEALFAKAVASEQERDAARAARDRTAAALAQAEAARAAAALDLEETVLRAPMDGVVAAKTLHPGAMVSASAEIFEVVATDPLRVLVDVPTTALPLLRPGETKLSATVDAYPGEAVPLLVSEVYPAADPATRSVPVRALLPNPDGRYRPGMFVSVAFALDEREGVLVVPFESVLRIGERRCVYRAVGGKAVLTTVEVGLRDDDVVEIVSGLSPEDVVVTDGLHRLSDGVAIRVFE